MLVNQISCDREETSDKGSVCGMAAVYQAGLQTILTRSELNQLSYNDVKIRIGAILGMDESESKNARDVTLLEDFYTGYLKYCVYILLR